MRHVLSEFKTDRLFANILAGCVVGAIGVIGSISFAAFIFTGELSSHVSTGIGLTLFSGTVFGLVIAFASSYPVSPCFAQDIPAAAMGLMASAIAASMTEAHSAQSIFATILISIGLSTLLTGLVFFALGWFRLGSLIRFIPYPVIGGFLAGSGWILSRGSFGVMTGVSLTLDNLATLVQPEIVVKWLPGLVFACALMIMLRVFQRFWILPAFLAAAIALFYGVLLLSGSSIAAAFDNGWLLGPFPGGLLWRPEHFSLLPDVNWATIVNQVPKMATIFFVATIALLLNVNGMEVTLRQDIDLNQELKAAGYANIASGLGGGIIGFHTMSMSVLATRMGANSRLIGVICAAFFGSSLLFGATLLSYFPKPVLGGLLLFLGLSFLVEWVADAWFKLSVSEYFVVLLILIVIGIVGFFEGIIVGILIGVIVFVVEYSRTEVVKFTTTGADFHSTVARPERHTELLEAVGEQICILKLQGFLFFGTANRLLATIRERADNLEILPLRYLLLDFKEVKGVDSSAVLSFQRMRMLAQERDFYMVITGLSPQLRKTFEKGEMLEVGQDSSGDMVFVFSDLDRGLEWCEEQMLLDQDATQIHRMEPFQGLLYQIFPDMQDVTPLMAYFRRRTFEANTPLMKPGAQSDDIFIVESGEIVVRIPLQTGKYVRLSKMGAGTIIGEMAMYLGSPRAAEVIATQKSTLYKISRRSLKMLEEQNPWAAAAFHQYMATVIAKKLAQSHKFLSSVLD
ncbi:MAG: SulP family inorganic anion transporter [Proteobacteria bacterium]|nr:SulP family inorganic anion transporter [Pseudomonadota bacterium]